MRSLLVLVGLTFVTTATAQPLPEAEAKEGFFRLFHGKDFSGWRFNDEKPTADNWKVEAGVIKLSGGGKPHLASQWDFEDFDIRFEWRGMRANYNSGFYIRAKRNVGNNQLNLAKGSEGALVGGSITGSKGAGDLQNKPMDWNEWRVVGQGDKITFWCNGKMAWEGTGLKDLRGHFGFQAEGAPMEFRNLRIKELGYDLLGAEKLPASAGWKWDGDVLTADGKGKPLSLTKAGSTSVVRLEWKAEKGAKGQLGIGDKLAVSIGDVEDVGSLPGGKPTKKTAYPVGEWNFLDVRNGSTGIDVWLNGTTIVTGAKGKLGGPITLGVEGGAMQFRAIRVKEAK